MGNATAAMLVIGDEILSGRTRDSNMHHLACELTKHGLDLKEARVVSDERDAIIGAVRELSGKYTHVFTSGGIGPTHDDITADCVAEAFGKGIGVRADAAEILGAHYAARGVEFTEARKRMARIPDEATLIDNPVSAAPGFTLENVHVMAGVPSVFEAMVAGVLATVAKGQPLLSQSLTIHKPESEIAEPLRALAAEFKELSFGSYPFQKDGAYGVNVVIRGFDGAEVETAMVRLAGIFGA